LIDVNRIFLVDHWISVIRSKIVGKKNKREKECINARISPREEKHVFFRRYLCASLAASSFLVFCRQQP